MKLTLNYTGDKQGFKLDMDLEATIEQDAEALGYITNVLFRSAETISDYLKRANPVYWQRISQGVTFAEAERAMEENPNYPFTKTVFFDE